MSRLTKKYSHMYTEKNIDGMDEDETYCQCLNKLGKLEDIEEELGCPLDVVIEALKQENQELKRTIEECSTKDALFLYNNEHQRRMELQLKLKSLQEEIQELKDKEKEGK